MSVEKWVAVPVEPSMKMIVAGDESGGRAYTGTWYLIPDKCYTAMLAARPTGPDVPVLVDRAEWEALQTRMRELEERDRKLMSKLGQFKPTGNVQLDALLLQPDSAFEAFRDSLPETYWARYDLSAVRLGWHYGKASSLSQSVSETAAQGNATDWKQAVDDALVTCLECTTDSYTDPKKAINDLICWNIAVATDPRVNGGFTLVPLEPTPEMRSVYVTHEDRLYDTRDVASSFDEFYADLIAAALRSIVEGKT